MCALFNTALCKGNISKLTLRCEKASAFLSAEPKPFEHNLRSRTVEGVNDSGLCKALEIRAPFRELNGRFDVGNNFGCARDLPPITERPKAVGRPSMYSKKRPRTPQGEVVVSLQKELHDSNLSLQEQIDLMRDENSKAVEQRTFTHMLTIKSCLHLSSAQVLRLNFLLKHFFRRNSITASNLRAQLRDWKKHFAEFYEIWEYSNPTTGKVTAGVRCTNVRGVLEKACELRGISLSDDVFMLRESIDTGKKFLKISASLIEKNEFQSRLKTPAKKKARTSFCTSLGDSYFLSSGTRRMLVLAIFPDGVKEDYHALKSITDGMGYEELMAKHPKLNRVFSADIKATLEALGLQSATSTYPCPYCLKHKSSLRERDAAEERTVEFISSCAWLYQDENYGAGRLSHAKKYFNSLEEPLPAFFVPHEPILYQAPPLVCTS